MPTPLRPGIPGPPPREIEVLRLAAAGSPAWHAGAGKRCSRQNDHPAPAPIRSRVEDRSRGHSVKCRVAMTRATVHRTSGLPGGACARPAIPASSSGSARVGMTCPAAGAGAPDGLTAVDRNKGKDDRRLSDHYSVHAPEHPFSAAANLPSNRPPDRAERYRVPQTPRAVTVAHGSFTGLPFRLVTATARCGRPMRPPQLCRARVSRWAGR